MTQSPKKITHFQTKRLISKKMQTPFAFVCLFPCCSVILPSNQCHNYQKNNAIVIMSRDHILDTMGSLTNILVWYPKCGHTYTVTKHHIIFKM